MKKKCLYIIIFFTISIKVYSQGKANTDITDKHSGVTFSSANAYQINNLSILCKVWGFLKYYHPALVKGEFDMDTELFKLLPKIYECKTKDEFNTILLNWINGFGKIAISKNNNKAKHKNIAMLPDFRWLNNDSTFSKNILDILNNLKNNPKLSKHYYAGSAKWIGNPEFINEKPYIQITNPDAGFRLLCLFRYWNIIQYFFPYKDLIVEDWNSVIPIFMPKFLKANDSLSYRLTTLELIAQIHDTHANIWGNDKILENYRGNFYSPAQVKYVEENMIVAGYFNNKLADTSLLKIGDIITKVNSKLVKEIINEKLPYTPASNYSTQLRDISKNFLRSNLQKIKLTILRHDTLMELEIPLVSKNRIDPYKDFSGVSDTCFKMLNKDVSYFNLGKIKTKYFPQLMKIAEQTKGMIIDLRSYPSEFVVYKMDKYLLPTKNAFVKFSTPKINYPGCFKFGRAIKNGGNHKDYYKGKVVILINEITQSQAEFTTMAFRNAPKAIVVGSTTAGADGDMSFFSLPGGIKTGMSGLGVFYPNGKQTQRIDLSSINARGRNHC
jgi:hypothetical protein